MPYATLRAAAADWQDGRVKLLLTALLLRLRQAEEALFAGDYQPWHAVAGQAGVDPDDAVGAFLRRTSGAILFVAFARFPFARDPQAVWRFELPETGPEAGAEWQNVLTLETVPASGFEWRVEPGLPFVVLLARAD
jgi:maltooligosyltrehalose synthase